MNLRVTVSADQDALPHLGVELERVSLCFASGHPKPFRRWIQVVKIKSGGTSLVTTDATSGARFHIVQPRLSPELLRSATFAIVLHFNRVTVTGVLCLRPFLPWSSSLSLVRTVSLLNLNRQPQLIQRLVPPHPGHQGERHGHHQEQNRELHHPHHAQTQWQRYPLATAHAATSH